jgi:hydrogenase nickel incorporation protein HypA/HybF
MHELSIALSIIDLAEEEMRRHGGDRVRSIRIDLGALAGVATEALQFSFGLACEGTPAEGSSLIVHETSGRELDVVAVEIEP